MAATLVKSRIGVCLRLIPINVEEATEALIRLDRGPVFQVINDGIHRTRFLSAGTMTRLALWYVDHDFANV